MTETLERLGHPLFEDNWSNAKLARIATLVARGYSGPAIAAELNDGTTGNQISAMVCEWGLHQPSSDPQHTYCDVPVPLAAKHRTSLAEEARRRGAGLPQLVASLAITVCRDGLYTAILDP